MKKGTMIFAALFTMFTSCITSQSFMPVKGHGETINKSYNVSDFHQIDVSGGIDVVLVQGNTESLTLSAQENLFEYITVKVDQGILRIYTENNIMSTRPMKARIAFMSIDRLKISGGGDVSSETPVEVTELGVDISGGGDLNALIHTGELNCHISGGGDATIDGSIQNYKVELSGGGDIKSEITAGTISCNISGGGDLTLRNKEKASDASVDINGGGDIYIEVNAEKLKCSVSGGGNATLKGQAAELEIKINGGGDVNAGDFLTRITSFTASGGSDIHVNASQELIGQITGGGDVFYSGSPEKVDIDAKGGSEIHRQ